MNVKGKDGQGASLLMNVVRTLTTSASEDQREYEKRRLEQGYADTGQAIQSLIQAHETDLTECLQSFRYVSSRIQCWFASRERIRNVSTNISACKSLLQCKRDELKKLWLENAEQKRVVEILDQVGQLKSATNGWRDAVANKHYLRAAQLLIQTSSSLESKLSAVQGLDHLRSKMGQNRDELYEIILDELYRVLYLRPCEELAGRVLFKEATNDLNAHDLNDNDIPPLELALDENSCLGASDQDQAAVEIPGDRAFEGGDMDEQPVVQSIAVLVDALAILARLPVAVHAIQLMMPRGLHRCLLQTQQLCVHHQQTTGYNERALAQCLQYLFRLFKCTTTLHALLINQMKRARRTYKLGEIQLFTDDAIINHIQECLMEWLKDVLGVSGRSALQISQQQDKSDLNTSLSVYFARKRPTHHRKKPALFKFTQTTHAISIGAMQNDDRVDGSHLLHLDINPPPNMLDVPGANNGQLMVCPPSPDNIMQLFRPMIKFAAELERKNKRKTSNHQEQGQSDKLSTFLYEYVQKTYLTKIQYTLKERADAALQSSSSYSTVVTAEEQRRLDAPVAVLDSSARTLDLCRYVGALIQALPPFAGQLAALWLLVLAEYRRNTQRVYEHITRSIRQPEGMEPQEWRKISAAWAVDEDISRLLKSLPNWMSLVIEPMGVKTPLNGRAGQGILSPSTAPTTPLVESADQIRLRNKRESEILIGNLGSQKRIEEWELIFDMRHISSLAYMHESLEWFAATVRQSLLQLPPATLDLLRNAQVQLTIESLPPGEVPEIETLFNALEKRLQSLEEMASTCLLMLHLEVRVHCFYHLLPLARQPSHVITATQSQEADPRVLKLSADLQTLHRQLAPQLQSRKVRYIFEGLGHLVSAIFIHSSHHINKINDNGKKQMCRNIYALQQTISSLTNSREPDLDDARRFFELLYRGPDEILNGLVEKEPRFSQLEYQYLLALAVRSHPQYSTEQGALEKRLDRLKIIMADRGKAQVKK